MIVIASIESRSITMMPCPSERRPGLLYGRRDRARGRVPAVRVDPPLRAASRPRARGGARRGGGAWRRAAPRARRRPVGLWRVLADDRRAGAEGSAHRPGGIPSTYVPARNTVFLALALAWAEALGAADIFIGVNALDYSGYPDCRPEFIEAFERLASLATAQGVGGTRVPHPCAAAAPHARPKSSAQGRRSGSITG